MQRRLIPPARPIRTLLLPALLVLTAACGGPTSPTSAKQSPGDSTAPSSTASAVSGGRAGPSHPSGGSAAPRASGVGSPAPGGAGTSPGPGATRGAGSSPAAHPAVGAAPGQYVYDAQGTVTAGTARQVSGTATLKVDPLKNNHQHSLLTDQQGSTEEDLLFPSDGTHLDLLTLTNAAFSKTFTPSPSVLLLPTPPTVGRSWSWSATSTDGKTTATTTNKIVRMETLTVGTEQVVCAVIDSVLTLTGDVTYRGDSSTWYSTAYRIAAKAHQKGSGNVNGFPFSSDITSVLRSTHPA